MEPVPSTPRRVAWRWLVATLCAAWIVTILPALPLPHCRQIPRLFGSFPDWRDRFLWVGGHIGAAVAAIASLIWGSATGALRDAHLGSGFVPLSFRAWFAEVTHWGDVFGTLLAAATQPWMFWALGRIVSRAIQRPAAYRQSVGQRMGTPSAPARVDPSLVLAGGWSLALGVAFVSIVTWQSLHPVASWLMMPPVRGATIDTSAPLAEWCAYSFHTRARECETALGAARMSHAYGIAGFAYDGARCVPVAEDVVPSMRATTVTRVTDALERALAGRAVVRRDHRIGKEQVDLAVLGNSTDGRVLLALDVGEGPEDARIEARAARLAALGVPDYWRVELYPSRDPLTMEMLRIWKDPDVATRRYASVSASSHNADLLLRPTALADVRIPIDEVLPFACERANSRRPAEGRAPAGASRATGPSDCHAAPFVLDTGAPSPTLVFDGFGTDRVVASRLRFAAISMAPEPGFDPVTTGLAIGIRGPYPNEEAVAAVLPAGDAWRRVDGAQPSWIYRDPAGSVAGITEVTVRSADGQRFAWEIRGERGQYRVPMGDIQNWRSLGVYLGSAPNGHTDPCSAVFFRTVGSSAHCLASPPDTLTCRGPDSVSRCSGDDPDSIVRCAVQQVAAAEEIFFTLHDRYFSGNCDGLAEIVLPPGVVCGVTGTSTIFNVAMSHPRATKTCIWTSNPAAGSPNLVCS